MNIRVFYPNTEKGKIEFQEKIAKIHGNMIMKTINNLDCSYESKMSFIDEIKDELKRRA